MGDRINEYRTRLNLKHFVRFGINESYASIATRLSLWKRRSKTNMVSRGRHARQLEGEP